jgi:hypothetical protein
MAADPFPPSTAATPLPAGRFSLLQLFYAVLLVGAGFGSGHPVGIGFAFAALLGWCYVFCFAEEPRVSIAWLLLSAAVALALGILVDSGRHPREVPRRMQCQNNLKQIGLALHRYSAQHGSFPPAYLADASGQPAHSWRVLLLPHLEEQSLYQLYYWSEPWNGRSNNQMGDMIPGVYSCPSQHEPPNTPYRLLVGSGTLYADPMAPRSPDSSPRRWVVAVEDHSAATAWLEPRDMTRQEALDLLTDPSAPAPHHHDPYWYESPRGRHVLLFDGTVIFVEVGMDRAEAEELLGMRPVGSTSLGAAKTAAGLRRRYDNWLRAALLFVVALLPLPWAGGRREL